MSHLYLALLLLALNSFFFDYLSWYKSLHSFIKYQSIKEHQRSKMKLILILATLLAIFEASNACINPCNGVTAAHLHCSLLYMWIVLDKVLSVAFWTV